VEENKNRVMEIILSSVEAHQLIWGKVLGLVGAGLLQVFFYLALISMATIYLWVGIEITLATLAGYFVYWMLGHLLFAGLLLATGILFGGQREANQFAVLWLFVAVFPIYFAETLIYSPNGLLARALSFIPLTSPIAMVFRVTKTSVPIIDVVISLALLMVSIYLVVRGAARILRAGSLMYGKRFTLPEVARWLREA
jgi:ABC-2 type transport system permease protein